MNGNTSLNIQRELRQVIRYSSKSPKKQISCLSKRFGLIMENDFYLIAETSHIENTKSKSAVFHLNDYYVIQRMPKISGKCTLTHYFTIQTNLLSQKDQKDLISNKLNTLAVVNDYLVQERFKRDLAVLKAESSNEPAPDVSLLRSPSKVALDKEDSPAKQPGHEEAKDRFTFPIEQIASTYFERGFGKAKIQNLQDRLAQIEKLIAGAKDLPIKPFEERKPGYKIIKEGGVECCNPAEISSQEGIVLDVMKRAGKELMQGKNVVGISLPVRIFEPRSTIERITDWWAFGPIYLRRAANTSDPVERMKNVMTFAVAGLYTGCKQMKPFNPILGETYQGFWPDGSEIYCEHISHHPPVTNFLILDHEKKFTYSGYYEYKGSLAKMGNSVLAYAHGPNRVKFHDGSTILFNMPQMRLSGMLWGKRIIEWLESLNFTDEKNNLFGTVRFYKNESLLAKNEHPSDYFEVEITKLDNKKTQLATGKGAWTSHIEFNGKRYWDLEKIDPIWSIHTNDPLPSDCRFREDMIWIARKDMNKSQEWKLKLEEIQRRDRRLRHENKAAHKK